MKVTIFTDYGKDYLRSKRRHLWLARQNGKTDYFHKYLVNEFIQVNNKIDTFIPTMSEKQIDDYREMFDEYSVLKTMITEMNKNGSISN